VGVVQMGNADHSEPTPVGEPEQSGHLDGRKPRARKRPRGAPTHVRSWPLRTDPGQCRDLRTRFFTGARVYNAVLSEFIARSRAVKSDPAWQSARQLPRRTKEERAARRAVFDAIAAAHGFTTGEAQTIASSLRKTWVRKHLPAQETQSLGVRAFDAVKQWHVGRKGKPRMKSAKRGLHSLAAKDGHGALRPATDASGRLVGLQWGAGFVIPIAVPAQSGRRGKEHQAELAQIEALIAAGKVLSTRIVRTVINGRDTYRMQLVMDGHPTRRHPVGGGRVSFDLGPSQIAVTVKRSDGSWMGWIEPLADRIRLDSARLRRVQRRLARQHRAGSPGCMDPDGTHKPGRCDWQRSTAAKRTTTRVAEQHRRRAEHRKTLHGALANRLFTHGTDMACEKLNYRSWQKNFPRSVRDRAPGLLVSTIRRKAESAGGDRLYEYSTKTTALSQTCLCGDRKKKPLSQRVHRCRCGIKENRDLFSAYLGLHVRREADGSRQAGSGGSQPWLAAPPSGRRWVAEVQSRSTNQPARPQTSALAEVSGAHQGPQGLEATEPVGANVHDQPAHGVGCMSNETAGWHRESPYLQYREDVKRYR
jgi:putative transposase